MPILDLTVRTDDGKDSMWEIYGGLLTNKGRLYHFWERASRQNDTVRRNETPISNRVQGIVQRTAGQMSSTRLRSQFPLS